MSEAQPHDPSSPERHVYRGELFGVGTFRCPVDHPAFSRESVIRGGHLVVFPRTSVIIAQAGRRKVVADPNVAVFYNDGQAYTRHKLSDRGDHCDFFSFAPRCAAEAVSGGEPGTPAECDRPFARACGPVDAATYMAQRSLLRRLQRGSPQDALAVEEAAMALLAVAGAAAGQDGRQRQRRNKTGGSRRQRLLARTAQMQLAKRFQSNESLSTLARDIGCSAFHLSRVFRRETGTTLCSYRNALRLRCSLERVAESGESLTDIALDLGYSSHSHFAGRFKRMFGLQPSAFRAGASRAHLDRLRKIAARDKR